MLPDFILAGPMGEHFPAELYHSMAQTTSGVEQIYPVV